MDYNSSKYCRVCLEDTNVLTSIFNTEFAMTPADMLKLVCKVTIFKNDGMPAVICNNCIYRLGVAFHFKQQCENSDLRLREYYGLLDRNSFYRDANCQTDDLYNVGQKVIDKPFDQEQNDETVERKKTKYKSKSRRYKRKAPEERKKRGPKPTAKEPQTCFECNKVFKCNAQLLMHIRTHSGERPFACNYCPRRFAQKHNLTIHIRTHNGEKPYVCEICSKQFCALGNLQTHKKIHDGIRDQICHICNKAFINAGDLSRHITCHSGVKNHHCDTCGKSYTRNRDMLLHKKKVHQNEQAPSSDQITSNINQPIVGHMINAPVPQIVAPHAIGGSLGHPSAAIGSSLSILPPSTIGTFVHHGQRIHPY